MVDISQRWRLIQIWLSRLALITLLAVLLLGSGWASTGKAIGATFGLSGSTQRPVLTLDLLDQRLAEPVRQGGALVVDLKGLTVDLRANEPGNSAAFADLFYQRLRKSLNGGQPLGLDLSYALIQGDLDFSRLSLRVPAYGGLSLPVLDAFNREFQPLLSKDVLSEARPMLGTVAGAPMSSPPGALARSLLIQAQPAQLDRFVFRGPLLLVQTCFNGETTATDTYFLSRVEATQAIFTQQTRWRGARFARSANFSQGQFQQESSFRSALFARSAQFNQASFSGFANWQGSTFHQNASFARADFQAATFGRSRWQTNADFDQANFHGTVSFQKSRFDQALFLTDAQFESPVSFRQAQFQQPLSLRGAHILSQLDFGDARFAKATTINVTDLDFSAEAAKILGSPGQIGRVFSVPALANNETVLRSLVRNFRLLEQISDANQLEYTTERLRLAQIQRQIFGVSLNQARSDQLVRLGLRSEQARAVIARSQDQPFVSPADLLGLDEIDLATYLKVRDRITTQPTNWLSRAQRLVRWLLLAGLLTLSHYGTNVGLTFSVGLIAMTLFALVFWLSDRYRRRVPTPIVPTRAETVAMAISGAGMLILSLSILSQNTHHPARTLAAVLLVVLPVPGALLVRLYQQGRYHDLMDRSYFVENGALRQIQVLIARLPVIPKYPFYRDRYTPLLADQRWNWLNYYDFSFNNWFKFGFNDIRLRDRAVPGLISALAWYQWSLGTVYIALLLWTLSRTIPGLNLLLYF